ncbi:hypothetical protein HHI36_001413 [Cryptolaemus montrouzieri]|uniref:Gustatory receptor n=1 Tax=Cryptolaemus montrouzieri TaxID=559131 RepID=A0ABD2P879_9CUCU
MSMYLGIKTSEMQSKNSNEMANKTVIIIHDIWNKYAENDKIDKRLLYLQFISTRFLSTKLKFTAYGFFPIDWTLLHTIVASAATYIIILVQLKR